MSEEYDVWLSVWNVRALCCMPMTHKWPIVCGSVTVASLMAPGGIGIIVRAAEAPECSTDAQPTGFGHMQDMNPRQRCPTLTACYKLLHVTLRSTEHVFVKSHLVSYERSSTPTISTVPVARLHVVVLVAVQIAHQLRHASCCTRGWGGGSNGWNGWRALALTVF